jgi:uncharacterized membrane protein YidH (DUF202 family)
MPPGDPEEYDPGLARERTRLAWARTAIAFAAVGAVVLRKELVVGAIVLAMAPLIWWLGRFASGAWGAEQPRRLLLVTVAVTAVSLLAILVSVLARSPVSLDQLLPRHG